MNNKYKNSLKAEMDSSLLTAPPMNLQPKQEETLATSDYLFRSLSQKMKVHPFVQKISKNKNEPFQAEVKEEKLVKPKMFLKVVQWMEKLTLETLGFSQETLEISIRALKIYLDLTLESPKKLQMLGCICLHLASKMN